jgi:DNA ligase-1
MKSFARLLDALIVTPSRNGKLRLVRDWLAATPDPDRGYGLAALTGDLDLKAVKPALLRALVADRVDAELFRLSYDYVGDLAETIALIWEGDKAQDMPLSQVVGVLSTAGKVDAPAIMTDLLDRFDAASRYALIKLATGGLRAGLSARLARTALFAHRRRYFQRVSRSGRCDGFRRRAGWRAIGAGGGRRCAFRHPPTTAEPQDGQQGDVA